MPLVAQEDPLSYTISILNSKGQLTSEDILAGRFDSEFTITNSSDKLDETELMWLRINLENETHQADWAMVIDRSIPTITVYDNGIVKRTGAYVSFNSKDVRTEDNVVRLSIENGKSRSIYLKIETHNGSNKIPELKFIHWESWQTIQYKKWSGINLITGLYIGSTLLLSFGLFFFYATTKDKTYALLGIYLISHIIYELGAQGYYWHIIGGIPKLFWYIQSISLAGFYLAFIQFLKYYFNLKIVSPFWNKVFIWINFPLAIWFVFMILYPDLELIRSIFIIGVAVVIIIFFIQLLLNKNPIVKYVFWGSITFFMSLIVAILLYNFNINFVSPNIIVKAGIIGQVIFYILGLTYKIKLTSDKLENLVQERTNKITNQNQKLIDYAFRNAHNIRGPLARILGLVNLITIENKDTNTEYVSRLSESAKELDISIRDTSKRLEDEDFIDDGMIVEPPN